MTLNLIVADSKNVWLLGTFCISRFIKISVTKLRCYLLHFCTGMIQLAS